MTQTIIVELDKVNTYTVYQGEMLFAVFKNCTKMVIHTSDVLKDQERQNPTQL